MTDYLNKSKKYKGYHYSVLSTQMLSYLHTKTLEMLKIIVEIFEKNEIRYMICGGTLLGAVTTGHFIPWDDDVDLCVLEEDYDRMIERLCTNVPEWMEVQCRRTEPHYYHGWVKVRDKGSKVHPSEHKYLENGVWIDIYQLRFIPEKKADFLVVKEHINYLVRRMFIGGISPIEMTKRMHSERLCQRMMQEVLKIIRSKNKKMVYIIWSASKIILEQEWCFPEKKYRFEGLDLCSFNMAQMYLKRHYGEKYMFLPADEMRRVGISEIDIWE